MRSFCLLIDFSPTKLAKIKKHIQNLKCDMKAIFSYFIVGNIISAIQQYNNEYKEYK